MKKELLNKLETLRLKISDISLDLDNDNVNALTISNVKESEVLLSEITKLVKNLPEKRKKIFY